MPHDADPVKSSAGALVRFLGPILFGLGLVTTFVLGILRGRNGAIRLDESNVSNASQDHRGVSTFSEMQSLNQEFSPALYETNKHIEIKEVSRETVCFEAHEDLCESPSSTQYADHKDATQLISIEQVSSSHTSYDLSSKRIDKRGSGQQKGFARGGMDEDISLDVLGPTPSQTTMNQPPL